MPKTGVFGYSREAVRVKVKKCENTLPPEYRKFSIDPQITSFEVLQSLIAKAFDIRGDFAVSYKTVDDYSQEALLPLLSDWDLDAAFLSASDPCLVLQVDIKSVDEQAEEWTETEVTTAPLEKDVFGTIEIPRNQVSEPKIQNRIPGLIMNRMEKTLSIFQKAFNLGEDQMAGSSVPQSSRPPLTDAEFRKYLDPIGQISQMKELRTAIYYGGVEPVLRKVVWKLILNVYPEGMSGKERMDYIKRKSYEYELLRDTWRDMVQKGQVTEELTYVTNMVRKDVLRTDRHHKFYAGSDDNQNIASLFNVLTTYALNHPSVSYCQGMSDLASPLLVTMGDEAHAYICFCALMTRLKPNFMLDGITMTLKFQHLTEGLMYYDPEFHAYLKQHQAEDLLFCYRWLLLEMKREFAFDDALHMLEVLWSSLPPSPPIKELPLYEIRYTPQSSGLTPPPISPLLKTSRENPYTKVCALRRQSSSMSLNSLSSSKRVRPGTHRQNQSLDETTLARQNRLRKQRAMKPFSSLDDNCVQLKSEVPISTSRSISPMNMHSESDVLGVMKKRVNSIRLSYRNGSLSSSMGNLMEVSNKRNLSKRLAEDSNIASLNETGNDENDDLKINKVHRGRIVKNLNEFLNFTNFNKPRVLTDRYGSNNNNNNQGSQCRSISEGDITPSSPGPVITVTKSPVDEVGSDVIHSDMESVSEIQNSSPSYSCNSISPQTYENDESSPDDSNEYTPMTTSMTRELRLELDNLDRQVFGSKSSQMDDVTKQVEEENLERKDDVFVWENPLQLPSTPDEQTDIDLDETLYSEKETNETAMGIDSETKSKLMENGLPIANAVEEGTDVTNFLARSASNLKAVNILNSLRSGTSMSQILRSPARSQAVAALPTPKEFGDGNPFLMFLCLTLIRQHRDHIIRTGMDYNEMAMHFDKMVRKHNVTRVLDEARQMFAAYLKQQDSGTGGSSKKNIRV